MWIRARKDDTEYLRGATSHVLIREGYLGIGVGAKTRRMTVGLGGWKSIQARRNETCKSEERKGVM